MSGTDRALGAAAILALLAGCAAPAATPTPSRTPEGPRTLADLIEAAPESPRLEATADPGVMAYESEGLTITGALLVPPGDGPFPAVIVVHGAVDPATFVTGGDLVREQEALVAAGYMVFAPDLRGLGGSDPDPSAGTDLGVGATADLVNAARALEASGIPSLDVERIALLGHSLGGAQSIGAMVVAPELVDAVVTIAPVSTRVWWVVDHYLPRESAEYAAIIARHGSYEDDPAHWDAASPASYASRAAAPLLIAVGTADDPVFPIWEEHTVADFTAAGADVELLTVEAGNHRLDPHWDAAWTRILAFLDETLGA